MTCIGPNCLGFVNLLDRVPVWSGQMPSLVTGDVAVVSQSGATAHTIATFAALQNIGLSHVISTGNEAMVDTLDMAAAVLEDERVRAVAMFLESIRDVERLRLMAARAAELEKPIVMMKVGTSALAAEIALTHTGALVGDDRIVDAALRQLGIVRVHSLEQLAITAGLLARTGPLPPGGLGVVSISGGACDIIADQAELAGVALEPLAETTQARLSQVLASYGTMRNPLDITGAASENPQIFADALSALAGDPSVAILAAIHVLPTAERAARFRPRLEVIATGLQVAGKRGILVDQTLADIDRTDGCGARGDRGPACHDRPARHGRRDRKRDPVVVVAPPPAHHIARRGRARRSRTVASRGRRHEGCGCWPSMASPLFPGASRSARRRLSSGA